MYHFTSNCFDDVKFTITKHLAEIGRIGIHYFIRKYEDGYKYSDSLLLVGLTGSSMYKILYIEQTGEVDVGSTRK